MSKKILGRKVGVKSSSRQVSEKKACGEKNLVPKIGVKILDGKWVKQKQSVK